MNTGYVVVNIGKDVNRGLFWSAEHGWVPSLSADIFYHTNPQGFENTLPKDGKFVDIEVASAILAAIESEYGVNEWGA